LAIIRCSKPDDLGAEIEWGLHGGTLLFEASLARSSILGTTRVDAPDSSSHAARRGRTAWKSRMTADDPADRRFDRSVRIHEV